MIYFYLCGFNNNDTNPSFYEEQLSATEARSGFGWIFFTYRQAVNKWKLSHEKKKKQQQQQ